MAVCEEAYKRRMRARGQAWAGKLPVRPLLFAFNPIGATLEPAAALWGARTARSAQSRVTTWAQPWPVARALPWRLC
jgi:hypothetical protein